MTDYPSDAPTEELAELFPTRIPDVETLVYDYVKAATAQGLQSGVPALSFYTDRVRSASEGLLVDVVAGWPAYPTVFPVIGVAAGPEGEDQQHELPGGGFAGDVVLYEDVNGDPTTVPTGTPLGSATYFTEPLSSTVLVELVHENRDERDRLHNELRRVLFPMRRLLPQQERLIRKVAIDAEKQEQTVGPPAAEEPFDVYISVFTVHVLYEMLEATDVGGPESVIARVDVVVDGSDTGP